jgi:hypothetical protein
MQFIYYRLDLLALQDWGLKQQKEIIDFYKCITDWRFFIKNL